MSLGVCVGYDGVVYHLGMRISMVCLLMPLVSNSP